MAIPLSRPPREKVGSGQQPVPPSTPEPKSERPKRKRLARIALPIALGAAITPQASSANLLFVSSGYLTQGELYRMGALYTLFYVVLYLVIGTPWLILVAR